MDRGEMDIARSSVRVFAANLGGSVVTFLGITFFANALGAGELGAFFLFQAAVGIVGIAADFGIRGAVEKRLSEGDDRPAMLSTAVALKAVPLAVLVAAILLFRARLNAYFGAEFAGLLAAGVVLYDLAFMMLKVLGGELRVAETAILRFGYRVAWIGCGTLLTLAGFGATGLVYSYLAGLAVMLVWGLARRSTPFGRPSLSAARSLFDYAKFNFVSMLGGTFYSWVDVAVIGFFLTTAHVGAYEVAWRVTALVILFSNAIGTSMLPQFSEWDAEDSHGRIEQAIHEILTPSLLFVVPAFFGTLVFSREIMGLVFGTEFAVAGLALIVLMGEKLFQAVHVIVGRSLLAVDRPDLAARATAASLVANVCLNLLFVWQFGIVGAAVATLLAAVLNDALHYVYLSRFVTIRVPVREIGWCVVASVGMTAVLVAVREVHAVSTVVDLASMVALGVVTYGALVLYFRPLRRKVMRYAPLPGRWANADR